MQGAPHFAREVIAFVVGNQIDNRTLGAAPSRHVLGERSYGYCYGIPSCSASLHALAGPTVAETALTNG